MIRNSCAGRATVCGRCIDLWRRPLHHFVVTRSSSSDGTTRDPRKSNSNLSPILKPGFQPTGTSKDGVYLGSTFLMLSPCTLPELDVSSLLNKRAFIRNGTSINGNDFAIRLSKAKNELREVIREELEETTTHDATNDGGAKKLYIARGHGVPNQLLQHFVSLADRWLEQKKALELWVDSGSHGSLSVLTTDGESWRTLWPLDWMEDEVLYLASMKRMVSHLGSMTPFCNASSVLPEDLKWRFSISRNNRLPLTLYPNDPQIFPVIEWIMPMESINSAAMNTNTVSDRRMSGRISIRLQGPAKPIIHPEGQDYVKQPHNASLNFEAYFENRTNTPEVDTHDDDY